MLHRRTLHLESLFPRRVSRPATGRPRRKRNDRSNYGDGGACRGCLWECARAFSSLWTRQGVVDGRERTGSRCFAAFHCLPINAHTPHRLDIDWRRSRATWLLRRPRPRTYSRLSSFYYMLYACYIVAWMRGCARAYVCVRDDTISRVTMSARPRPRKPLTFDRGFLFSRPRCWPDTLSIGNDPALSRHQIHQIRGMLFFFFFSLAFVSVVD